MTLEKIYHSHLDSIFRICLRYCKDRQEAEDLTQEVFLRIDKGLGSYKGDAQLGTWIYRVSVNCCLDHLRSRKRRDRMYVDYVDALVLRNLSPLEDRALAKIDLDRILGVIRPSVRRILFLTLAEGLSYREAAEVVGTTKDAVAKTVSRFLARFKGQVRPPEDEPAGVSTGGAVPASKGDRTQGKGEVPW